MRSPPRRARWVLVPAGALLALASAAPAAPAAPRAHDRPAATLPPPGPAKRKSPPEGFPPAAVAPFVEAVLADKAGDLDRALRRYEDANKISEQPVTLYNLADVLRRMERWKKAIAAYRRYVAAAPDAPDRAEVERLALELELRPGVAVIDGDEPDALVFVDGKLVGPSPVVLQLGDGLHHADRVAPTGYAHRSFRTRPADTEHVRASAGRRPRPGNVILSSNSMVSGSWRDGDLAFELPGRFALPPGRHETYLLSRGRACTPIRIDAPPADQLVYVYVEVAQVEDRGCAPITVTQQRVRFAP